LWRLPLLPLLLFLILFLILILIQFLLPPTAHRLLLGILHTPTLHTPTLIWTLTLALTSILILTQPPVLTHLQTPPDADTSHPSAFPV
jgi:hypothetical protein